MVQEYHQALVEFIKGNPEPVIGFFSRGQGVSLANPFGGFARGRDEVPKRVRLACTYYKDGRSVGFENIAKFVAQDLAYIVEIERYEARTGGREEIAQVSLRVTSIFRREDGTWKLVHRQADPLVDVQSSDSGVSK